MGVYFYGNDSGVYKGIGDRRAEKLRAAINGQNCMFFYMSHEMTAFGVQRRQQNAMASSVYFQSAVYGSNEDSFLYAQPFSEEVVLSCLHKAQAEELRVEKNNPFVFENSTIINYLRCSLTSNVFFGGLTPALVLDSTGVSFERQVREIAKALFQSLPSSITEGCCICTSSMQPNYLIQKFITLLPTDIPGLGSNHVDDCEKLLAQIDPRIIDITRFWSDNEELLCRYHNESLSLSDWETVQEIADLVKQDASEIDLARFKELWRQRKGKCWKREIENVRNNSSLQDYLSTQELNDIESNKQQFLSVEQLSQYCSEVQLLLTGEALSLVVDKANNCFTENTKKTTDSMQQLADTISSYLEKMEPSKTQLSNNSFIATQDALKSIFKEKTLKNISDDASIETFIQCLKAIKAIPNSDDQNHFREAAQNKLLEECKNPIDLLCEAKKNEKELRELLSDAYPEFQKQLVEKAETQILSVSEKTFEIKYLEDIERDYLIPFLNATGMSFGRKQEVFQKVYDIVKETDNTFDYTKLLSYRQVILKFTTEEHFEQLLEEKAREWEAAGRESIQGALETMKEFPSKENISKVKRAIDKAIARDERADGLDQYREEIKQYVKEELNLYLENIFPAEGDTPELFDPLKQYCDTKIWKKKFSNSPKKKEKDRKKPEGTNGDHIRGVGQFVKRFKTNPAFLLLVGLLFAFFIGVLVLGISAIRTNHYEREFVKLYEFIQNGDASAADQMRMLAEHYEPARIVMDVIPSTEPKPSVADTVVTSELPSTTEEIETTTERIEETPFETNETYDSSEKQTKEEYYSARSLWENEEFNRAKEKFDELSSNEMLTFSTYEENDPELEYGAVCALTTISGKEPNKDLLIYLWKQNETNDIFDLQKPLFCFVTSDNERLFCGYSISEKNYAFWCSDNEDKITAQRIEDNCEILDLLKLTRIKEINKKLSD